MSGESASTACLEFAEGAGMWCAVECSEEWRTRTQSLFRWLADTGIGGERSIGWGRSAEPEFDSLPARLTADGGGDRTSRNRIFFAFAFRSGRKLIA